MKGLKQEIIIQDGMLVHIMKKNKNNKAWNIRTIYINIIVILVH